LKKAWAGWQAVGAPISDRYARMIELTHDEYFAPPKPGWTNKIAKTTTPSAGSKLGIKLSLLSYIRLF